MARNSRRTKEATADLVRAARRGDVDTAARCELSLLGVEYPTPEQTAAAILRAHVHEDIRCLRSAYVKEE